MSEPIIKVENLGKKYQLGKRKSYYALRDELANPLTWFKKEKTADLWALRNINFKVSPGERVGVIGRNGAGKSTLLKALSQITPPTTGKIKMRGRVASLLEVGTGFHPELTGRENIYLNGAILGMSRKEINQKFDEIVAFSEIEKFLDTPVKRYSSGMYVRLAFAVAAHLEPEILLIDEVLAVGDAGFQKKCLGKMAEVGREGRTILFVSHNMGAISNLCSRTIYLDHGKIKFDGKTDKCIAKYIIGAGSHDGQVMWKNYKTAPGNENVKLKYVKILSNSQVTGNVFIDKDIVIEIGYWSLKQDAQLASSIHLKDSSGTLTFASANFPSACLSRDEWYGRARPKGLYRSTCTIPANFLNDTQYSLDVGVSNLKNEFEFNLTDIISFQVVDSGAMKKEYMGHWGGAIRPKLLWTTELIKD